MRKFNSMTIFHLDFDKTIIRGDSIVVLEKYMNRDKNDHHSFWRKTEFDELNPSYFSVMKKMELLSELNALENEKVQEIYSIICKDENTKLILETFNKLKELKNEYENFIVLISTNSFETLVKFILDKNKFEYDHLIAGSIVRDGKEILRENSGVLKLYRLKDFLKTKRYLEVNIVAFSDHISDLPILLDSSKSYHVKRKGSFDDWSDRYNFNTIYWT